MQFFWNHPRCTLSLSMGQHITIFMLHFSFFRFCCLRPAHWQTADGGQCAAAATAPWALGGATSWRGNALPMLMGPAAYAVCAFCASQLHSNWSLIKALQRDELASFAYLPHGAMMRRSPVGCASFTPFPVPSSAAILLWFPLDAACARLPLFVLLLHGIVLRSTLGLLRPAAHCTLPLLPNPLPTMPLDCAMEPWPLSSSPSPSRRRLATNRCANFYSALRLAESLSQPRFVNIL